MARRNIMIVENDIIIANDIISLLEDEGYTVCCAVTSGEEAVESAVRHRPDLVLMNVDLFGKMTGIEAAEFIVKNTHTPIIFVSAYPESYVMNELSTAGSFRYVSKPVDPTELLSSIEKALSNDKGTQ